jgi:hypothetical protein
MAISDWVELCRAAGYRVQDMELMDVYLLAGAIIRDPILWKACLPHAYGASIPPGTRDNVLLKEWTTEEKRALRERIAHSSGAVIQFPGAR